MMGKIWDCRDERRGTGDEGRNDSQPCFTSDICAFFPQIVNCKSQIVNRIFLFLLFFLLSFQHLLAQVATITGSAPNFIGKEIRLVVQDDPISGVERVLDRTEVNEWGGFKLSGEVETVQYGFLQVGRECGDLFLERGKSVTVRFAPAKRPKGPEGFNDRFFFRLDFIDGDGARLNRDITRYNERLDGFLANIYPLLRKQRSHQAVADSVTAFRSRLLSEFPVTEGFISDHIKYSIGNVEQTFILKKKMLHEQYLKDRPALPWNPEYMRFIEQLHEGVFQRMALVEKRTESIAAMRKSAAFSEMESLLRQQPFMENAFVRRAVMIRGMELLYGQKGFDPERVSATLRDFAKSSDNPVLAKAARNIADRKDRVRPGTAAPNFTMIDSEGKTHRLDDFKGHYLMLEITEADNAYCLQEAAVLRDMQKRFSSTRFLTVLVGSSDKQLLEFKRDFAPARPVATAGRNDGFMAEYAISSLPTFIIIGPDGRIYRAPALDPSKGGISELEVLEQTGRGKRNISGK